MKDGTDNISFGGPTTINGVLYQLSGPCCEPPLRKLSQEFGIEESLCGASSERWSRRLAEAF